MISKTKIYIQLNFLIQTTMDQLPNDIATLVAALIWVNGIMYVSGKPVLDYAIGKDSFWSRYLNRPLTNYLTEGSLRTEEQFQAALAYNRNQIKRDWLAKIIRALP